MSSATFDSIKHEISLYIPCFLLLFGNIGCSLNFLTFTTKKLRENSCGWYFLMSAIIDFLIINFGLITKLLSDYFGISYQNQSRLYCKLYIYIIWVLPCISTSYLVLATLDRCLSTSEKTHFRSFSRIRIARRMTIIPIILYGLTSSHQLYYFDLRPKCSAHSAGYSIFISIYSIVWTSLIPQISLLIFGLITYRNLYLSRKRLLRENTHQTNRIDINLLKLTFIQVIFSSILLNIRTIYYSYSVIISNIQKSQRQIAFESLLYQISTWIFLANFSKSFYLNTLMSQLFRQILIKRISICFNRIIHRQFRIHTMITNNLQQIQN